MEVIKKLTISNKKGWHARPCARIVRLLTSHPDINVFIEKTGSITDRASGKNILELMKLGLDYGDTIAFIIQGKNKQKVMTLAKDLLNLIDQFVYDD